MELGFREFDIEIKDRKGIENVAADNLSQIENEETSDDSEVDDNFPRETLMEINVENEPWFADFANYLASDIIPKGMTYQQKIFFLRHKTLLLGGTLPLQSFYWPTIIKEDYTQVRPCEACQKTGNISKHDEMPLNNIQVSKIFDIWGIDFMGPFPKSYKFEYILVVVDYVFKWAEAQALPTNDARVVITFLKKLFCHFGMLKALISDRGTHFCNKIMEKTMKRYGVNHQLSTSYHPQTSGQIKNTNRALKRILEKAVKDNPAIWSRKFDDALWAFRTAYKTPTGTTPYKLIYGKNCHLPFEIKHRAYWALKNYNPDLIAAGSLEVIPSSKEIKFKCFQLLEIKLEEKKNLKAEKGINYCLNIIAKLPYCREVPIYHEPLIAIVVLGYEDWRGAVADINEDGFFCNQNGVKYVTQVRLAKQLTVDSFDDLFDYLQEFEKLVNASRAKKNQAIIQGDRVNIQSKNSGNTGRNSRRAYVQEEVVEGMNAPKETGNVQRTLRTPSSGNTSTVQCYNYSGKGHYARNCPKPRVRDSKYFMEQMLLAKQDEAGVILTDEQNDFLFADASRMEEIKELSANICLMARIQPADHTSDDGPSYESAFISEVQSSSIDENNEPMYPTHTKIINNTIGDDQININIKFDSLQKGNVNSSSVEKDTHVPIYVQ
ncbi:reverse transcriptase domain-containing protein [Tanacetum coccineum]|uniref:Reverse transcriptase domain-containing protein n=1 Tax=Tanacetum coccineum TaxID=301880 RepID=A0ABQ5DCW5_9ASTR